MGIGMSIIAILLLIMELLEIFYQRFLYMFHCILFWLMSW